MVKIILYLSIALLYGIKGFSQQKEKQDKVKVSLKDTLDGKLDMSEFLINANGFIPVPQIITQPALGGFGGLIAPVFIKPNKHQIEGEYTPPNITAAFGGYTANNSWFFGGMRMASLPKYGLKYRVGMGYAHINMDFYRTLPIVGEKEFSFTFNSVPVFMSLMKEVKKGSKFYIGLEYLYLRSKVSPNFDFNNLPYFLKEKDFRSQLSHIGVGIDYDTRDNIFTPDTGTQIGANFMVNANWTGSDYQFQNFNVSAFQFFKFSNNWISGFRLDTKFIFGDAPFYAEPSVELRGVPISRYQGTEVYVFETEQRYDFSLRWSALLFGGLAKASSERIKFNDATLVYSYGAGFRYLLARLFKLRVGIDVAKSNDDWGYYITFGSAWNNRN
ncbi:BamA/TamA family outer membrane protein [Hanstruepera ponticola]|uniref:BamA/TamA family outer membrane protein n=1 Tax=Hanstruepera ponticola TaxID=2042995 RepID=UPI000CF0F0C4|nr:BamA/TamA family outer membrane protein [Hanstruepera ponticola]